MARLPESPRRLNVHWSENHLKTWKPDHLINFWAAETVQLNIAEKTTEATPILSPALIICNHIQISTQPDSAAIVIVKEVVTIVIMTALRTILPQHRQGSNQQIWSYDQLSTDQPGSN